MEQMRKCKRCGETKPLTPEYYIREKACKGGFRPICKDCQYGKSGAVPRKAQEGHKICSRCGEEKPLSPEFWAHTNSTKDDFHTICKACKNKTDKMIITWNRDGFRICTKCGIEKPLTEEYYAPSKIINYGFNSACRACSSKKGRQTRGTFKEGYSFCRICSREYELNDANFPKDTYFESGFSDVCYNCRDVFIKTKYQQFEIGCKFCIQCGRQFPETTEFFFRRGTKFDTTCKECRGYDFGVKQIHLNRKRIEGHKYCTQCGKLFPLSTKNFYRNPGIEDGFGTACKKCLREKELENRRLNIDEIRRKKRVRQQYRNSRKKNLPCDFTDNDWELCKAEFDNKCCYCGQPSDKLQQEHFVSVSKGGGYVKENILPACPRCNTSKKNKDFLTWYKKQDFYDKDRALKIIKYLKSQKLKKAL